MELFTTENLIALLTLTSLEIVLGIDNTVFIAIIAARLPEPQKTRARLLGLTIAVVTRVLLLLTIAWMASLTAPLFYIPFGKGFSGRDLILLAGGLFLIWKATKEIHAKTEGVGEDDIVSIKKQTFAGVVFQIILVDLVFSLDSVITAVGMTNNIPVMIAAVIIAIGVMLISSGAVVAFIDRHPTVKMLALSFLLLIGFVLVAEGWGKHIEKGYIYFAMAFSLLVEMLNLRVKRRQGDQPNPSQP